MLEMFSKTTLNPLSIYFFHCLLLWYRDTYIRSQVTAKQATVHSPLLGNNSLALATTEELWKRYFPRSLRQEAVKR
jgi:hypothetical protein